MVYESKINKIQLTLGAHMWHWELLAALLDFYFNINALPRKCIEAHSEIPKLTTYMYDLSINKLSQDLKGFCSN